MYISSIYNKDMRKLIKKLLRESLLDEGAFNSSHLPEGTGLFAKEQNSSELVLYVESEHTNLLTPTRSGDVRSEAFNVWKKMYNREDVIKKTLQPTDKNFKYDILFPTDGVEDDERQEAFDELLDNEKEALIVFNSGYTKEPSKGYYDLLRIAQQYDEDTYELASKIGDGLWKASY